jgi:hypothetical protein
MATCTQGNSSTPSLADRRNHGSLDLAALRDGCSFGTDYPEIIRRANSYFV